MLSHNTKDREPQLVVLRSPKIKLADHAKIAICIPCGDKEDMTRFSCPKEHGGCGKEWIQSGRRHPMLVPLQWHVKGKHLANPLSTVTVELVESGRPSGEARQVMTNKALDMGVEYILYWDDDVIPDFNALNSLHAFMERNPGVGAVTAVVPTRSDPVEPFVYRAHGEGAWWDFPMGPGAVPQPIHGCGAGFLLARASAIREVQEKLGDVPIWADQYIPVGESEDEEVWGKKDMEHIWGHDIRFARLLNTNGWPVYVDGKQICKHVDVEENKIYEMPADSPGFTGPRDVEYGDDLQPVLSIDYPAVDVIVVNFNAPKFEERTVEAVKAHTVYPNYNLAVKQNSPEKALSKFWNELISESTADYICLLNNDTVVTTGWLTSMVDRIRVGVNVGAVVPSSNIVFMSQIDTTLGRFETDFDKINDFAQTLPLDSTEELETASAMCVLFPRDVWEEAGKFDEDFFLYGEDTEFFWRVRNKLKKKIVWDQSVYVHHYKAQSTGQMDPEKMARIRKESEVLVNQKTDLTISHGAAPAPKFWPGSNLVEGWTYQPNPFDDDAPSHRKGDTRLDLLETYCDFTNKFVLDIGCNIGYFGHVLEGYKTYIGIDHDPTAIAKAKELREDYDMRRDPEMQFINKPVTLEKLQKLDPDVVLAFSVLPWLAKAGEDLNGIMEWLGEVPREVYIELMYEGDGMSGGLALRNDQEARQYLEGYFPLVTRLGKDPDWRSRTLWKCGSSTGFIQSTTESPWSGCTLQPTSHGYFIKIYPEDREGFAAREFEFLTKLEHFDVAPKPVSYDGSGLIMTRIYGRQPAVEEIDRLHQPIVDALDACGILHRDIRPENLLISNGKLYLLDFEWAIFDNEKLDHPEGLGSKYRLPGFPNKETFENIVNLESATSLPDESREKSPAAGSGERKQ